MSDWMIADAEVPMPGHWTLLRRLGVRWRGAVSPARPDTRDGIDQISTGPAHQVTYRATGRASEARDFDVHLDHEGRRHAGADFVLTVGRVRFQVQFEGWVRDVMVGSRVSVTGRAEIIGGYEWEAFELGEVRADWRVITARPADNADTMIDLAPASGYGTGVYDIGIIDPAAAETGRADWE